MKLKPQKFMDECIPNAREINMENIRRLGESKKKSSNIYKFQEFKTINSDFALIENESIKSLFENDHVVDCALRHLKYEINFTFDYLKNLIENEFFSGQETKLTVRALHHPYEFQAVNFICEENQNNLPQFSEICSFAEKTLSLKDRVAKFIQTLGSINYEVVDDVTMLECEYFTKRDLYKIEEFKSTLAYLESALSGEVAVDSLGDSEAAGA